MYFKNLPLEWTEIQLQTYLESNNNIHQRHGIFGFFDYSIFHQFIDTKIQQQLLCMITVAQLTMLSVL